MFGANNVLPGDIVAAACFGYEHVGIFTGVTADGVPTVASASKKTGRVVEETWATFAGGGRVRRVGYPGACADRAALDPLETTANTSPLVRTVSRRGVGSCVPRSRPASAWPWLRGFGRRRTGPGSTGNTREARGRRCGAPPAPSRA